MSGVFNKSGENVLSKALVQTFSNHQMPTEVADFRAFYLKDPNESTECPPKQEQESTEKHEEKLIQFIQQTETSFEQLGADAENMKIVVHNEHDEVHLELKEKQVVQFAKLHKSHVPSEWEDVGSQTDHSDMSEGHYSDETMEDRDTRERRNESKRAKRHRRMAEIVQKHRLE